MPYVIAILGILVVVLLFACVRLIQSEEMARRSHSEYAAMLQNDRDEARARLYEMGRVIVQAGELLDHVGVDLEDWKLLARESKDLKALGSILRSLPSQSNFLYSDPEAMQRKLSALGNRYGIEPLHRFGANGEPSRDYDEARMIRIGEAIIVERVLAFARLRDAESSSPEVAPRLNVSDKIEVRGHVKSPAQEG